MRRASELTAGDADPRISGGLRAHEAQLELCAGDLGAAEALLDGLAGELARQGERFMAGYAAGAHGSVALLRGAPADAVARLTAARDHYAACDDICSLDGVSADLAEAATMAGREHEARAALEHALGLAPERPFGERSTHLLHQAARAAARAGETQRAARLADAAATASRRDPIAIGPWHAPAAAGDVALMAGDPAAARRSYRQARAFARDVQRRAGASLPVTMYLVASELRLAQAAEAGGDRDGALAHARAALELARRGGAPAGVGAAEAAVERLQTRAGAAAR